MTYDVLTAERVRHILSARRDVAETKLMGGLCFMVKGSMCCSVSARGGLLVRIGPPSQERLLSEPHVRPVEMRGRPVAGFVRVDPDGYQTDAALKKWVQRGLDFVATLPAKSSRKTSPKASSRKTSPQNASRRKASTRGRKPRT